MKSNGIFYLQFTAWNALSTCPVKSAIIVTAFTRQKPSELNARQNHYLKPATQPCEPRSLLVSGS